MRRVVAPALKRGWAAVGQHVRTLRKIRFSGVAVLCYHGLLTDDCDASAVPFADLYVRESVFDEQCRMLRKTCHPISLDDWRHALAGDRPLPARPVLITFDDGYRSVATIAAPILGRYELPATVFVCSDPIARRRLLWFDYVGGRQDEAQVQQWKQAEYTDWLSECARAAPAFADDDPRALMSPDEVSQLSRTGLVEIGAHTARHPILARAGLAEQRTEIVECQEAIRRWTNRPVRAFAYPNGQPGVDYSSDTVALVREAGFDFGFTTRPAFAKPDEAPLERSRFVMLATVTAPELAYRLAFSWPR